MRYLREWVGDMKNYCVYIMADASGVIYIGVTNGLERGLVSTSVKQSLVFLLAIT